MNPGSRQILSWSVGVVVSCANQGVRSHLVVGGYRLPLWSWSRHCSGEFQGTGGTRGCMAGTGKGVRRVLHQTWREDFELQAGGWGVGTGGLCQRWFFIGARGVVDVVGREKGTRAALRGDGRALRSWHPTVLVTSQ